MNVSSIFTEAFAALKFNKLRSVLTIASLAWGVACFVILYAYGNGFGLAISGSFKSIGQDLILVFGGQTSHPVIIDNDAINTHQDVDEFEMQARHFLQRRAPIGRHCRLAL